MELPVRLSFEFMLLFLGKMDKENKGKTMLRFYIPDYLFLDLGFEFEGC